MRFTRHFLSATSLFLLATLLVAMAAVTQARAADEIDADEYDVTARVARVSLLSGDVQLRRAGNKSWERAKLNFPLVEGDQLATGRDARLEIQIDARNFVRVGADSVLQIITLRDEGVALSLAEGTATVRLARFERDKEYFEVDAPKTTVAAEKRGLYRLDAARSGNNVRVIVRDGGRARIYSETSGFVLRDGRMAELVHYGAESDWELSVAPPVDDWDRWTDQREYYLAQRLRYDQRDRYYDRDVWGAEELDAYGDWYYANNYGWVWRPHVTVINNYYNWAPYRYGRWTWCPPYGWTWVGDEPWGWAPYHYGRWVYFNNSWCWAPRGYGYTYKRSWWRPALVAFVYIPTSYGEHVAWYPLTYGQRDPRSRHYRQITPDRLTPLRAGEIARLQRTNPAHLRAVTTLPARDFGRQTTRTQPASDEIARRAISNEPVRGRLPITPPAQVGENTSDGTERRTRAARPSARAARSDETLSAPQLPERATGAATRRPGVALDNELRRARVFNGREPRVNVSGSEAIGNRNDGGGAAGADVGDTGAVTRPARPTIRRFPVERNTGGEPDSGGNSSVGDDERVARPARPSRRNPPLDDERPTSPNVTESPETEERRRPSRVPRPSTPPQEEDSSSPRPERPERNERIERPARPERMERPERIERPERNERPERMERPEPVERPERIERNEAPPPRQEEPPAPRPEPPPPPPPAPRHEEQPPPPPPREQPEPSRPAPPPQEEQRPSEPPRERGAPERPARPPRKVDPDTSARDQ